MSREFRRGNPEFEKQRRENKEVLSKTEPSRFTEFTQYSNDVFAKQVQELGLSNEKAQHVLEELQNEGTRKTLELLADESEEVQKELKDLIFFRNSDAMVALIDAIEYSVDENPFVSNDELYQKAFEHSVEQFVLTPKQKEYVKKVLKSFEAKKRNWIPTSRNSLRYIILNQFQKIFLVKRLRKKIVY